MIAERPSPAMALQRPELGILKPGRVGDASVLSVRDGEFGLETSSAST